MRRVVGGACVAVMVSVGLAAQAQGPVTVSFDLTAQQATALKAAVTARVLPDVVDATPDVASDAALAKWAVSQCRSRLSDVVARHAEQEMRQMDLSTLTPAQRLQMKALYDKLKGGQ